MKKTAALKIRVTIITMILTCASAFAQSASVELDEQDVTTWYETYQWLNGLKLTPHLSINRQEFSSQYHLHPEWWDKAFEFLKNEDLVALAPGRYIIVPDHVIAFVADGPAREKEEVNWETHAAFNDLQYIISGKTFMGITSVSNPRVSVETPYNDRQDTETYVVEGGDYYEAGPGTFFIFSPKEIHRPAFKADGYDTVKKILIKIRVP